MFGALPSYMAYNSTENPSAMLERERKRGKTITVDHITHTSERSARCKFVSFATVAVAAAIEIRMLVLVRGCAFRFVCS